MGYAPPYYAVIIVVGRRYRSLRCRVLDTHSPGRLHSSWIMIMMKKVLLVFCLLVSSQLVWAANTNVQNGESNVTIRQKLNLLLGTVHNVRQAPYNAHGDKSHDDHDAIQAAITDACSDGVPVYLPPAYYKVGSTLSLFNCPYRDIHIIGAGRDQSVILGNFPGFVIDNPDLNIGCCKVIGIEGLGVGNSWRDVSGGAVRMANINPGSYIRDCTLSGYTALDIQWNTFTAEVSDCNFNPPSDLGTPGTVAVYMAQVHLSNTKIAGYDIGVSMYGPGAVVDSVGVETSNTGFALGLDRPLVFRGSISGNVLTIDKWYAGHTMNFWSVSAPYPIDSRFCTPCQSGTTIVSQLTNTNAQGEAWKEGTYTVNISQTVAQQTMMVDTGYIPSVGAVLNGLQTERDDISLFLAMPTDVQINGSAFTGTVGVGIQISGVSYSSANGGTATFNLKYPAPGYTIGVHDCSTDNLYGGYSFYHQTCTWSTNQVVRTGIGADPGPWGGGYATVAPLQHRCVYADFVSRTTIANTGCSHSSIDGYTSDFYGYGGGTKDHFVLFNSDLGYTKSAAPSQKSGIRSILSVPGPADQKMSYNDLPGPGTGNGLTARPEGEMYYIVDGNQATIGRAVTGATTTNPTRGWVTWNGSAWTLMSK